MAHFLAIYTGTPDSARMAEFQRLEDGARRARTAEGMQAWHAWNEAHKAHIVIDGGPLGKTKRTDARGVSDTRNNLSGFMVIDAESHEAAARMFENHPHFTIFPGEAVEIMPVLPIPTM